MYASSIKRVIDIVAGGVTVLLLSPIILVLIVAIRLEDGGPAFFIQERVGRRGRRFRLVKFRSMPVDTPDVPSEEADDLRITRVGTIIRRTNLDELPQLFNIVKGDMSLVGPRPALPSQTELLRLREANGASLCRPGLTGAAQVNSYDGMSDGEKAEWDGWYAKRIGFTVDMTLIVKTFGYLLRRPPVY